MSRQWVGRLAHYRNHENDEHYEALVTETLRYVGLSLEESLEKSQYWPSAPLARRVAVLLFLVDRGVVDRLVRGGRVVYEPREHAEEWTRSQPALQPYYRPTMELIAALRQERSRRVSAIGGTFEAGASLE